MGKYSTFLAALLAGLFLAVPQSIAEGNKSKVKAKITRADCVRLLVRHQPDFDVHYQPGRDVYGRKVPPAGIPGEPGALELPFTYTIDLELDLRQFLGTANIPGLNPNLRPGRITVRGDRVYFNDRRLDNQRRYQVIEGCRKRLRLGRER